MLSKQIKDKLRGIIEEHMIPEYKELMDLRDKLRIDIENYVESEFLSPRDKELIAKYPKSIYTIKTIIICNVYTSPDNCDSWENFRSGEVSTSYQEFLLKIELSKSIPSIYEYHQHFLDLKKIKGNVVWKKFRKDITKYMKLKDGYLKKLDITYKLLNHKNTTLSLIRERFPKLYELYKK